ncbi:hypothetical protein Ahy_A03g016456 isoform A [Arachis hypogaea]|uniref:Myb-like domain-containing protein n=1 Tax=Arachis hypogaea TaxID=3818 RepID=A0A445E3I5_ARAHY|nr:hypothetical protein Ahy_A03g016456 isoform A [Arachis hypogaea]
MAAESNAGFHSESLDSALNRHAISFQPSAMNSLSEMVPMGNYFGLSSSSGMIYSPNSSIISSTSNPVISQAGNSSGSSLLLDSVPGLKHDAGLAVEWSVDEQYKLEEGLARYADEPSIMRYIKIAATLPDKTVRNVALRCRWMTVSTFSFNRFSNICILSIISDAYAEHGYRRKFEICNALCFLENVVIISCYSKFSCLISCHPIPHLP